MSAPKFWIVAAGTGGHIFPGLSLASELRGRFADADLIFFGTRDRLEARLIPEAGYPIQFLRAGRWKGRGFFGRIVGLFDMTVGFFQVLSLLFKGRPRALVSVGGYVSVPTALACFVFRIPVFILEPNFRAGLANRLLSAGARRAFCSPGADSPRVLRCPVEELGTPVRQDLQPAIIRERSDRILVLGGSQGALSLCEASFKVMRELRKEHPLLKLKLQCGDRNLQSALKWQREFHLENCVEVVAFISDIPTALAEADIVIARAGASTVSELAISGHPTILVPFPHAADDHQRINAALLASSGAALLVDEKENDFTNRLLESLRGLAVRPGHYRRRLDLHEKLLTWGRPRAAHEIVDRVLSLSASAGEV